MAKRRGSEPKAPKGKSPWAPSIVGKTETDKDPGLKPAGLKGAIREAEASRSLRRGDRRLSSKPVAANSLPKTELRNSGSAIGPGPGKPDRDAVSSPGARISRRAADRIRAGHVWVYASDVEAVNAVEQEGAQSSLIPVADFRGLLLGTALYSPTSQIALRLVSRKALDEPAWRALFAERLRKAIARRNAMLTAQTNACRLVFSEADELPGLVADKYGDVVILQLLTAGLNADWAREACTRVIREEIEPRVILERPDPRMRELEGLPPAASAPLYMKDGGNSTASTNFLLNGLRFEFDANAGQKTGAFLDQRENYAAATSLAKRIGAKRALDVCCYQGGFALHLAQVCERVTGIDASHSSLEVAERNLSANRGTLTDEVDWVEGDAFEVLRDWSEAGERFDAIVLDPPAFAKSHRAIEGALRGYKELNLRALKMLRPGGLLVTCSCSHHVTGAMLEGAVSSAAIDAGRRVRVLERRGATLDHPVVLNIPETEYLKCLILEVE